MQFSDVITTDELPDLQGFVITAVADYQGNLNVSPSGVTMLRTIGEMSIYGRPTVSGANTYSAIDVRWGVSICDQDQDPLPDPGNTQDLINERWLRIGRHPAELAWGAANVLLGPHAISTIKWDITQKARLRDAEVLLTLNRQNIGTPTAGVTWTFILTTRTLLVGDIT